MASLICSRAYTLREDATQVGDLFSIQDKVALVTGGSRGIGLMIARGFVEAGANDGFNQSNTYYFEKILGWSGLLIEAIPELHARCVKARKKAQVFQCALVAEEHEGDTVTMEYANLMSLVKGARKSPDAERAHICRGTAIQPDVTPYQIEVPARTLTQVLDQARVDHIDLLSLDVEGYELQALQGLDEEAVPKIEILLQLPVDLMERRPGVSIGVEGFEGASSKSGQGGPQQRSLHDAFSRMNKSLKGANSEAVSWAKTGRTRLNKRQER